MEIAADKPPFNGNLFEYEGGMMYFHGGIDAFCERYNVEVVEMKEGGEVWCLRAGKKSWEEFPFDAPEGKVTALKMT